jgi:ParB family chromosome partitioning protein
MNRKSVVDNLSLKTYDDIFTTDTGRENVPLEKVMEIPLSELHSFENHPFKVIDDDAMTELVKSIKENGMAHPGIARPRKDGGCELLAGHRRKRACELAGLETMRVIVREMDDDEAVLVMVDTNFCHRENLLLSEKAYAYKMKADAVKRQAGRPPKENGSQTGVDLLGKKSYEIVGEQSGESKNQVFRFIRLTELINELMEIADSGKIGFSIAVELSFLKKDEQELLLYEMEKEEATPNLSQAQRMKKHSKDGTLTEAVMDEIMREVKKEEIKVTFTHEKLKKYFPGFVTPQDMETVIIKLLEGWYRRKQEKKEQQ